MVKAFIDLIKNGGKPLINPEEIFVVTKATFAVVESLKTRQVVSI